MTDMTDRVRRAAKRVDRGEEPLKKKKGSTLPKKVLKQGAKQALRDAERREDD